jgi:hypothetical protein
MAFEKESITAPDWDWKRQALQPQIGDPLLKKRQALKPHTGPDTSRSPSSDILPRNSGFCRTWATPAGPNRFAINGLGLCAASAHRETTSLQCLFAARRPLLRYGPLNVRLAGSEHGAQTDEHVRLHLIAKGANISKIKFWKYS